MLTPADIIETFNNEQTAHAAIVHAPIVLTAVAALIALLSAVFLAKQKTLRWATLVACLAVVGTVWAAKQTGDRVYAQMGDPPAAARELAHEHKALAIQLKLISYAGLIFALGAWIPKRPVAAGAAWLTAGVAGAGAFWAASSGSLGGELVYDYGLGTPKPVTVRDLAPEATATWGDPRLDHYTRQVQPILTKYCLGCHGSDEKPAAGLRLSTAAGMFAGGNNGPAIVPGNPDESLIYQTISGGHEDIFMPPGKDPLSIAHIAAIEQWITDGAVWMAPE